MNLNSENKVSLFLLPPIPQKPYRAFRAIVKIPTNFALEIYKSLLTYFDRHGSFLASQQKAFRFYPGFVLEGPIFCTSTNPEPPPTNGAYRVQWRCNEIVTESFLLTVDLFNTETSKIHVFYIPVQVPLPDDIHLIIYYFHSSNQMFDWTKGPLALYLIVDGYLCIFRPRIFNGTFKIMPGKWTVLYICLDAFPDAPRSGSHTMSVHLGNCTSVPEQVFLAGNAYCFP